MLYYFRIYRIYINNAVSYHAQYRASTWLHFILHIVWLAMTLFLVSIFFEHIDAIAGWKKEELYLMAILWSLADQISIVFFNNITNLPDLVTDGNLDGHLTKPASPLFTITLNKINIFALYKALGECALLAWLFFHYNFSIDLLHITMGTMLFLSAVIINYSFVLILNTLSFWFYRINNVNEAWFTVFEIGKYPLSVLPKTGRILFLTVLPVAFIAYIPVATITGKFPWYGILYAVLFTVFMFLFAILFWKHALKKYSSASS